MRKLVDGWHPQTLRTIALTIALFAVILFFASQITNYLSPRMFDRVATSVAVILPIAVGQALVVMTRNIDLSVGSTVGVVAYLTGDFLAHHLGLNPGLALLLALGIGAGFGAINGVLVAWGRVPSIIVTLGTMALYRSFLTQYSHAKTITVSSLPKWLVDLPQIDAFTIGRLEFPVTVVLALVAVVIMAVAMGRLRPARQFYAVGSNPDAALMAGINAPRVVFLAFVLSGALAGLAGFIFLAKFGNITVVAGLGYELKAVAAVVVGGVSIMGGSGTVLGVLIGTVLVDTIDNSLIRLPWLSEFWREALLGMLILAAVTIDTLAARSLNRLKSKGEGA